jgi:ubiquinone/menaquinone biosynthesis C-methylase UbiE/uncharacterized protein YbaR (Trm112 family)
MEELEMSYICCPSCRGNLMFEDFLVTDEKQTQRLSCRSCNIQYGNSEGYFDFLNDQGLIYKSRREKIIRSIYAKVYTPVTNFMFLFCGGVKNARNEVLSNLLLKDGDIVIETGMGAGENFLWMNNHVRNLKLVGIDIQKQMMISCARNLKRWHINAYIYRADATKLPFRNDMFDTVFHLGAINLFADKKTAIKEMIRVAKPGTHIVIADETEKAGRLFKIFTGPAERIVPPIDMIPDDMVNIRLKTIWRGYGYLIEFDKPSAPAE